jgi:hypothetical protein
VIRDSDGQGILAGSGRLNAVHDALSAEEACLAALVAAMEMGTSNLMFGSDSRNLITALQSNGFDEAPGGRHLLRLHFHVFSISYIPRSCNTCAHKLGRLGVERDPDRPCIRHDPLPDFVTRIVGRDISA